MSKHTPGEWKAKKGQWLNGKERWSVIAQDNGYTRRIICETPFVDKFKDHGANAHLMAAAPKLLAILKKWQKFAQENYSHMELSWFNETNEVIAKAEGDSQ